MRAEVTSSAATRSIGLALAGAVKLVAARLELALDRKGELGLRARVGVHDVGERVDRLASHRRIQQRPGVEVLLVEEAETDVVAREQELDDRLMVAAARLVEADGAGLDSIKMRPGIARPE